MKRDYKNLPTITRDEACRITCEAVRLFPEINQHSSSNNDDAQNQRGELIQSIIEWLIASGFEPKEPKAYLEEEALAGFIAQRFNLI